MIAPSNVLDAQAKSKVTFSAVRITMHTITIRIQRVLRLQSPSFRDAPAFLSSYFWQSMGDEARLEHYNVSMLRLFQPSEHFNI